MESWRCAGASAPSSSVLFLHFATLRSGHLRARVRACGREATDIFILIYRYIYGRSSRCCSEGRLVDWTAFGIAALGILGTLLAPLLAHKLETLRQKSLDTREDQATLRLKIEETYGEIDRLQGQANLSSIAAMRIANGAENVPPQPQFDISRLRSNVALYFPECADAFQAYDTDMTALVQQMRDAFAADPINAVANYSVMGFARFGQLATQIRSQLDAKAAALRLTPQN